MKDSDGMQPVNFKYNRSLWAEFRRMVKLKYDLDGATAIKKLVDHAMRTRTIPGVEPRFDYSDGTVNDKKAESPTDGSRERRTGFSNLRRNGIIVSGDVSELPQRALIIPE